MSYAVGALLLRDRGMDAPLEFHSEYALKENQQSDAGHRHFEGSRRVDALKLWMTIRHIGQNGYSAITDRCFRLAIKLAEEEVSSSRGFELLTWPDTNIVCFRLSRRFQKRRAC